MGFKKIFFIQKKSAKDANCKLPHYYNMTDDQYRDMMVKIVINLEPMQY